VNNGDPIGVRLPLREPAIGEVRQTIREGDRSSWRAAPVAAVACRARRPIDGAP
jgi:hypothetical protein